MASKLLVTVATAAFTAALAASGAFAQDEQNPKHKGLQQGEPSATQQEPAHATEAPKKKLEQSRQGAATEQPKQAEQTGESTRKPVENKKPVESTEKPSKTRKMGNEEPDAGMKRKTNLGQQQPEEQAQPPKKRLAHDNAEQPAAPGTKPDRMQTGESRTGETRTEKTRAGETQTGETRTDETRTGEARTGNRGDVDVVGSLHVSRNKASQVRDTLFRTGERSDVGVDVDIGLTLPARVHPRPLPSDIVEIVPEYRDYDYVIVRDEIVIVEPQTRKVVEIIREGGSANHTHAASTVRLTDEQREEIQGYAREHRASEVERRFDVDSDENVPSDVELAPLPDSIVTEVPDIRSYDFFIDQDDEVVLVDPDSRAVVEVIH